MKSFGQVIREARTARGMSIDDLARVTKIKRQFLLALESQAWSKLPEFPVVQGFVRLIGHALEEDGSRLVAFLRRDYPPKQLRLSPKPDVEKKFRWSPKLSFLFLTAALILIVFGYLVYQYFKFVSPPGLTIDAPIENFVTHTNSVLVKGKTTQDSTIVVNNQPFVVDEEGNFSGEIEVTPQTSEVNIKATSRAGKETNVSRKIKVEIKK